MTTSPELLALAAPALVPPVLNTNPLPEYGYDRLDYGMTIGIERTPGGRLWACWVGGQDDEKAFFILATSDDNGAAWSAPRLVIDPHDSALPLDRRVIVGNLWLDPLRRLWLFFDQSMLHFDGRAGLWSTRCDRPDADTPQWTAPTRIWDGCALNKPVVLSSGEWMLLTSLWDRGKIRAPFTDAFAELDHLRMANVFVSRDQGATWERRGGVAYPEPEFDEAQLIERRDGTLWMTTRTHQGLWESFSRDSGATWSSPTRAAIANANSRHVLRRLRSGRLLLVKHGTRFDECPGVAYKPGARSQLTAFLSEDDGATWKGSLVLDERATVTYPDCTQAPDGGLFVSYDYNRDHEGQILLARFTEEDVLAGRCVSEGSALRVLISQPNPAAVAARHQREKLAKGTA